MFAPSEIATSNLSILRIDNKFGLPSRLMEYISWWHFYVVETSGNHGLVSQRKSPTRQPTSLFILCEEILGPFILMFFILSLTVHSSSSDDPSLSGSSGCSVINIPFSYMAAARLTCVAHFLFMNNTSKLISFHSNLVPFRWAMESYLTCSTFTQYRQYGNITRNLAVCGLFVFTQ